MRQARPEHPAPGCQQWRPAVLLRAGLALGACVLTGCAGGPRGAPPRLALVIGNAAYENVVPLKNPGNDAADICAALQRVGFKTLCHTNVRDKAEFDARVKDYVGQLGEQSVGVFYYSGHGVQAGNANYLIPTQVQLKSATDNPTRVLYNVDDLFDSLGKKKTRFQLVVLDACRADLFSPSSNAKSARTASAPDSRVALARALKEVAGASNGLQPIRDAPPGTMVLYATASKDVAFDGDGRNGPLTKHVLENIGTPGVEIREFFSRVTAGVEAETLQKFKRRTSPFIYGSFSGQFCFAGCSLPTVPPVY